MDRAFSVIKREKDEINETENMSLELTNTSPDAILPTHTSEKPYACVYCDRRFTKTFNLKAHLRTHTGERPFACEYCCKTFSTKWSLKVHVMLHTQEKPHECCYCHKRFVQSGSLTIHLMYHTGELPYSCTVCGKQFAQQCNLKQHALGHTGEKPHRCVQCAKGFRYAKQLKRHLKQHEQSLHMENVNHSSCVENQSEPVIHQSATEKLETLTQCVELDKHREFPDFPSVGEDAENILSEDGKGKFELYSVNVVGSHTDSEDTKMRIINEHAGIHTASKPLSCSLCGIRLSTQSAAENHMLTHTAVKPYACVYCDRRFTETFTLNAHLRTHTGEKPFGCDHCGKTFRTKQQLKFHVMVHTQEQPHECPYCHKRSTHGTTLTNHLVTHTGERPYSCTVCGKTFSIKGNTKQHAAVHTREKMHEKIPTHECHYCQKRFTQRNNLTIHLRAHTGERPYTCTVCEQTFKCSVHLKQHALVHSGEKPHQCMRCSNRFKYGSRLKRHSKLHALPLTAESVSHAGFTLNDSELITSNTCSSSGENFKAETGQNADVHRSHENWQTTQNSTRELYFVNAVDSCQQPENIIDTWNNKSNTDTGNGCTSTMSSRNNHGERFPVMNAYSTSVDVWQPDMCSSEIFVKQQQQQQQQHRQREYSDTMQFHPDAEVALNSEFSKAHPSCTSNCCSQGNAEFPAKRYDCENCLSRYSVSSQLQQHSLTHDVKPAYECEECRTGFTDYGQLMWHMFAHAEEICTSQHPWKREPVDSDAEAVSNQQTAAINDNLTSSSDVDLVLKRYVCENCPSRYSVSSQLQQHSLTHDVKPAYECEECRTRFTDYGQLLWHMLAHAEENHTRQFQLLVKPEPAD